MLNNTIKNKPKIQKELHFSEEVQNKVLELVKHFHLELDPNLSLAERIKKRNPEVFILRLAEKINQEKETLKGIAEDLKKELKMHQKDAEKLAHEIKEKVVPLASAPLPKKEKFIEKQPEEQVTNKKIHVISAEDYILEKIKGGQPEKQNPEEIEITPGAKAPETKNVEEMAKKMSEDKKFTDDVKDIMAKQDADKKIGFDKYKEPIE